MLRVGLFLLTNLAVVSLLGVILRLFGIHPQTMTGLLLMAGLMGFGGAFISLAMSKTLALRSTGAKVIHSPSNRAEQWLLETVQRQSEQAGIGMPDVAIFPAPDMNAFATGMNRNKALVAVSTGLLQNMSPEETEAVLAHEVAHVANGDMVTMALLQGVLNTFVVVLSRVIASVIDGAMRGNSERSGPGIGYFLIATLLEFTLGLFATMIAMWFSRRREFRADAGGARYASRDKMVAALQRLQRSRESSLPENVAAFGIQGGAPADLLKRLFLSHPPLPERIARLQQSQ